MLIMVDLIMIIAIILLGREEKLTTPKKLSKIVQKDFFREFSGIISNTSENYLCCCTATFPFEVPFEGG